METLLRTREREEGRETEEERSIKWGGAKATARQNYCFCKLFGRAVNGVISWEAVFVLLYVNKSDVLEKHFPSVKV